MIGESAVVIAPIMATSIIAAGNVKGDIIGTQRIELLSSAKVTAPNLVVHKGAMFEGRCAMQPEGRARVEAQVPMGRLGTLEEFASFCMPFIDGTSRFTTGQFVAYAGGWA